MFHLSQPVGSSNLGRTQILAAANDSDMEEFWTTQDLQSFPNCTSQPDPCLLHVSNIVIQPIEPGPLWFTPPVLPRVPILGSTV